MGVEYELTDSPERSSTTPGPGVPVADRNGAHAGNERDAGDADVQAGDLDARAETLGELAAYLRAKRVELCEEWASRIARARMRQGTSRDERGVDWRIVFEDLFVRYVAALGTASHGTLDAFANDVYERIVPRGGETEDLLALVLMLRDVVARALAATYADRTRVLNRLLDAYEPAANQIAEAVVAKLLRDRERIIAHQREALGELSAPVLRVRERLLVLPIIGTIDASRARRVTGELLRAIRTHRAKLVVMDLTGVSSLAPAVANRLAQTMEASRLVGAEVIVTGLSPASSRTLASIGVDVGAFHTASDLARGIQDAESLLAGPLPSPGSSAGHVD